jgi:hypothetical protein
MRENETTPPDKAIMDCLSYDRDTGLFVWLVPRGPRSSGSIAGSLDRAGYRLIVVRGKRYYAHRLAWLFVTGDWPNGLIDHQNVCPDDNRFANLRVASVAQNAANSRPRVKWKGVVRLYDGRYMAQITYDQRHHYLGRYRTPEEAHAVYRAAALAQFGEFARFE